MIIAVKYNVYMAYLDNCLFNTLQMQTNRHTSIRDVLLSLQEKSNNLNHLIKKNFIWYLYVKSIIGTIKCCLAKGFIEYLSKEQKVGKTSSPDYNLHRSTSDQNDCSPFNTKFVMWRFDVNSKFKINATVLEVNMMYEFEGCYGIFEPLSTNVRSQEALYLYRPSKQKNFRSRHWCFTGKRNSFNFVSKDRKFYIAMKFVPSREVKLNALFSVIDSKLVTEFSINWGYNSVYPTILYISYMHLANPIVTIRSYLVIERKHHRVTLQLPDLKSSRTELFDGPDDKSPMVKSEEGYIRLSTFQCYLKIYNESSEQFDVKFDVNVTGTKQDVKQNVIVYNTTLLSLNMCSINYIQHCVINVTGTDGMFLNVSILNMNYGGPNIRNCHFGGVSYYEKVYNRSEPDERKSFCGRYTRNPQNNSFDIVPMSYVTEGHSLLIVFYGYYPHNKGMEINMEITLTPCKGLYFCDKREHFIQNKI